MVILALHCHAHEHHCRESSSLLTYRRITPHTGIITGEASGGVSSHIICTPCCRGNLVAPFPATFAAATARVVVDVLQCIEYIGTSSTKRSIGNLEGAGVDVFLQDVVIFGRFHLNQIQHMQANQYEFDATDNTEEISQDIAYDRAWVCVIFFVIAASQTLLNCPQYSLD